MKRIAFPHSPGRGGPGTFQRHLERSLEAFDWSALPYGKLKGADVLLVVLGTRKLWLLVLAKLRRVRIIHRLDGVNWEHREPGRPLKARLVWSLRNWLMAIIRRYFADVVIYQSEFIKDSWEQFYGAVHCRHCVIYNGTDIDNFFPVKGSVRDGEGLSLLCVEGGVKVNDNLIDLLAAMSSRFVDSGILSTIKIAGKISEYGKSRLSNIHGVELVGEIDRDDMPGLYRSADLFLCLEINPPCPNSVVEAMASGLPVVGYDTGSLRELVGGDAGSLAAYGANPWKFEPGDVNGLCDAVESAIDNRLLMGQAARSRVLSCFDKKYMVERYIASFFDS